MPAISRNIRKALQGLRIERILLKAYTNELCKELESYKNGNYVSIEQKRTRYILRFYLTILVFLIFNSIAN